MKRSIDEVEPISKKKRKVAVDILESHLEGDFSIYDPERESGEIDFTDISLTNANHDFSFRFYKMCLCKISSTTRDIILGDSTCDEIIFDISDRGIRWLRTFLYCKPGDRGKLELSCDMKSILILIKKYGCSMVTSYLHLILKEESNVYNTLNFVEDLASLQEYDFKEEESMLLKYALRHVDQLDLQTMRTVPRASLISMIEICEVMIENPRFAAICFHMGLSKEILERVMADVRRNQNGTHNIFKSTMDFTIFLLDIWFSKF